MKEQTIQLLNEIATNAEMGKHTAEDLLDRVEDPRMKNELQRHIRTYEDLQNRARAMLAVEGELPKQESTMTKLSAKMGVKMKTILDRSPRNVAEMLIEGNHMGATTLTEALKENPQANVGAIALAHRLQNAENEYADQLESFL